MSKFIDEKTEQMVIGTMLDDEAACDKGLSIAKTEDFAFPLHKEVFTQLQAIRKDNLTLKSITVDTGAILSLRMNATTKYELPFHIKKLRSLSCARDIASNCERMVSEEDSEELFAEAFKINGILEQREGANSTIKTAAHATKELIAFLEDDNRMSLNTGFQGLDAITKGFLPGELIILAARPGIGKTAFALNCAANAAKCGYGVFFSSLEMTAKDLIGRAYAYEADIPASWIREAHPDATRRVKEAQKEVNQWPLIIDDEAGISIEQLRARARTYVRQNKLSMVIVDYLQLLNSSSKKNSRNDEVSDISRNLKFMAKELQVPVMALAQFNRKAMDSEMPGIHHLRESGAIEQDADIILILGKDPEATGVNAFEIPYLLNIAKGRGIGVGEIKLNYLASRLRFREVAKK